jgi:phospholipid/cholesterol/gamma-HCH transport system permease protein
VLRPEHESLFEDLVKERELPTPPLEWWATTIALGQKALILLGHLGAVIALLGQVTIDAAGLARRPSQIPWREISASIFRTGAQALGITAIVGFLVGVVVSYLSAQQLKQFGADIYIVNLIGVSVIRELGPVLAAVLIAGRSGSAMTAQLGVMRVTEELDAMTVMGIPHTVRLVLPKMIALAISMPLLVLWTDVIAILGGMMAARAELDIGYRFFLSRLPDVVPIANLWLGLGKSVVFGALIALIACHFGLRIEPNTESLGAGTTQSVVISITTVIVVDAIFAVMFSGVGIFK